MGCAGPRGGIWDRVIARALFTNSDSRGGFPTPSTIDAPNSLASVLSKLCVQSTACLGILANHPIESASADVSQASLPRVCCKGLGAGSDLASAVCSSNSPTKSHSVIQGNLSASILGKISISGASCLCIHAGSSIITARCPMS